MRDVVILGSGVAGLTAAYHLRDLDVEVIEADSHIGGRTLSETFDDGTWANYAAQYVSDDKTKIIDLADELGLELIPSGFHSNDLRAFDPSASDDPAAVESWIARLEDEQANRRPPDSAELDQISVAKWLEDAPAAVKSFFETWCGSLIFGSTIETSLYGLMLIWGDNRTSAFTDRPVARSNRGDTVFKGGTNRLTRALAEASRATLVSDTEVLAVNAIKGGYHIAGVGKDGVYETTARHVVSALPAPVAMNVIADLPDTKREALGAVRYGRNIATPISIAAAGQTVAPYPLAPSRPDQTYNSNGFVLRTPGDMDADGGCFHSYVHDVFARPLWDDPADSVQSGAARALVERFPQLSDRIVRVGYRRWRHALPHYSPGRMRHQAALEASVDGLHFCGDYVLTSNMDGAARSGELAARKVLAG